MRVVPRRNLPVILICRDVSSDLARLVEWLEQSGHERIILLDNASTRPALLEYYSASPHELVRLPSNLGHTSPWTSGLVQRLGRTPFAVSDPDILPDAEAPHDSLDYFQDLLARHSAFDMAGFGLHIDDLPPHYPHRNEVIRWETPFWQDAVEENVYAAHVDTTMAVYRPGTVYKVTEALRTGGPYLARHLPWYRDPRNPSDEQRYYMEHRDDNVGYWNRAELPVAVLRADNPERAQ